MRKLLYSFIWLCSIVLTFNSCSSGKDAFEHGDYEGAVYKAIDRLSSKPNHKRATQTLREAFPFAVENLQSDIDRTFQSGRAMPYSQVVGYYERLNRLAAAVKRCPGARRVIRNPQFFDFELRDAKVKAAPECYQAGMDLLDRRTRHDAKEAFYLFEKANRFVPGYRDAHNRMAEAKDMATLKVIVEQVPVNSAKYQLSAQTFHQQVAQYLHANIRNPFVRFYSPQEAEKENVRYPHQVLRMSFFDFVVGNIYERKDVREVVSKDSVKVGTVTVDGKKLDVLDRVKAKLTVYHREVVSKGVLDVQIVDLAQDRVLSSRKIPGEFVWFSEWGHFNGDGRALTKKQKDICKSEPLPPPPAQQLFIEFTRPIYSQTTSFLQTFYKKY